MNVAKEIPEIFINAYEVEDVRYNEKIEETVREINPSNIYVYSGLDSDSDLPSVIVPEFPFLKEFNINKEDLYEVLNECRLFKDETEIQLMKHVN